MAHDPLLKHFTLVLQKYSTSLRTPERNRVEDTGLLMHIVEENGDSVLNFGGLLMQKRGLISAKMGTYFCKTGVYFDISYNEN